MSNESDFSIIILEEISSTHLIELTLPLLVLEEGVTYYWRVKFSDEYGGESFWSDAYSFTTAVKPANNPPDQPVLFLPENDSTDVPTTPTLETESFLDPDDGDSHALTRWQISSQGDFSVVVLDQTSGTDLTSTVVSHESPLSYGETYYWRAEFYDNHGSGSLWSEPYRLTTTEPPKSGKAGVSGNGCFISTLLSQ
jgi:hypothetical protein